MKFYEITVQGDTKGRTQTVCIEANNEEEAREKFFKKFRQFREILEMEEM